jgi:hypothetical protein
MSSGDRRSETENREQKDGQEQYGGRRRRVNKRRTGPPGDAEQALLLDSTLNQRGMGMPGPSSEQEE